MNDTAIPTSTEAPPVTVTLGADLSPAVKALETAYRMIQKRYPDTPDATIVVKRDAKAWGHTTVSKVWAPSGAAAPDRLEIMISGENLSRGPRYVAATLLHEAAHARNLNNGIRDCDVNGRHNRKFAEAAEEMGLTVTEKGWYGWTGTEIGDECAKSWARMIKVIDGGLKKSAAAHAPAPIVLPPAAGKPGTANPGGSGKPGTLIAPPKRGNRNLLKATCLCGHSIRLSRGVLDKAQPSCSECDSRFLPAGE